MMRLAELVSTVLWGGYWALLGTDGESSDTALAGNSWVCSVMSNTSFLGCADPPMVGKAIRVLVDDAMCPERFVSYSWLLP